MNENSINSALNGLNMIVLTVVGSCMQEATKAQVISSIFQNVSIMVDGDVSVEKREDKPCQART